jgi:hypothetical protein
MQIKFHLINQGIADFGVTSDTMPGLILSSNRLHQAITTE